MRAAIARLNAADQDGLDADDYRTPAIDGISPENLVRAELALMSAVLKYARHAQSGRVDPSRISVNIAFTPPVPDSLQVLNTVAEAADVLRQRRKPAPEEREVTQLKEDFITMVSHDFRTPLAVIMTSNDMLERYYERLTQQRRAEQLQKIRDQVWYMTGLLDDVLLLGKARAKKLEFNPLPIDLKKVCWSVFDEMRLTDKDRHIFHFNASGQLGNLTLDAKLIHRILSNILTNAVKYSPDGGIIRLELLREEDTVTLRVSDQGIGIDPEEQKHIFEPFWRGSSVLDSVGGTGLGLSIVKDCVNLHGGTISVESEPDKGTTFVVRLPQTLNDS